MSHPTLASEIQWWKTDRSSKEIAERVAHSHLDNRILERRVAELQEEIQLLKNVEKPVARRSDAEFAARERLLRDEFERKLQQVQVDMNRERHLLAKQLEQMKKRLAGCICGEFRIEHVDHTPPKASAGMPERWMIRNSR